MELQVDCCTTEQASALMATEDFAANPVGVAFDPDLLLARLEEGEAAETLLVQPIGAPSPIPAAHGMT
jgi:hypothetical protein